MCLIFVFLLLTSITISLQNETLDGIRCDCLKAIKCKQWLSAVNRDNYLQLPICGYDKHSLQPLICCPRDEEWANKVNRTKRDVLQGQQNIELSCTITSQNLTPRQIAQNKCGEYAEAVFQSVFKVSIAGSPFKAEKKDTCLNNDQEDADTAQPREFPHAALIGYNDVNITWRCGGTLISERYVLSAAHCAETNLGIAKWVRLGEFDISSDEDVARPQTYKISRRIVHPDFNSSHLYHDIALFKLNKDIKFSIYVRPACLFTKLEPPQDVAYTIGWGQKTLAGSPSEVPKKIEMEIWSTEDCQKVFKVSTERLSEGIREDIMICSNETQLGQGAACQGDSGGALQIPLSNPYCMYGILGVMSYIKGCGYRYPTVFTRVFPYLPWLVKNLWPDVQQ